MRISIRQLAVFTAIARHESVSRGADEVMLTQSAASMALKELEESLGLSLFHRHGRRLMLNDDGRRLQPKATALLHQAREIEELSSCSEETSVLRIAATDVMADYVLGPVCAKFLEIHPQVQIVIEAGGCRSVVSKIEKMECDLGFADAPSEHDTLIFEPILHDPMVVFAAPSHAFANSDSVDIRDLDNECWCIRDSDGQDRRQLALSLSSTVADIAVAVESNSNEALKSAVRAGRGLGYMSRRALKSEFATQSLVPLNVRGLSVARMFGALRHPSAIRSTLQDNFRALLLTMLGANGVERSSAADVETSAAERPAISLLQPHAA